MVLTQHHPSITGGGGGHHLSRLPEFSQVAIVLYGYPPGIGATGTAALLNVPRSLYRSGAAGPWRPWVENAMENAGLFMVINDD